MMAIRSPKISASSMWCVDRIMVRPKQQINSVAYFIRYIYTYVVFIMGCLNILIHFINVLNGPRYYFPYCYYMTYLFYTYFVPRCLCLFSQFLAPKIIYCMYTVFIVRYTVCPVKNPTHNSNIVHLSISCN